MLSEYFVKNKSLAVGAATCGSGFGSFVIGLATGGILSTHGLGPTILLFTAMMLLCGLFLLLFKPLIKKRVKPGTDNLNDEFYVSSAVSLGAVMKESFKDDYRLFKQCDFIVLAISAVFISPGFLMPFIFSKDRAKSVVQATDAQSTLVLSLIGIGSIVGRIGFGIIGSLKCVSGMALFITLGSLAGLVTILSVFAKSLLLLQIYSIW